MQQNQNASQIKELLAKLDAQLRQQFLAQTRFTSLKVREYVTLEFGLNSETDLEKRTATLIALIKAFSKEEQIEYLTIMWQWYQFKYAHYPINARFARLYALRDLTLETPIHLIQPIRYIEYITLATTIPTLHAVMQHFTPLEVYITEFVAKLSAEPPKKRSKTKKVAVQKN